MSQNLRAAPGTRPRQASPEQAPSRLSARTRWLALAVLCVTVLIANLDNTVLNVALPTLVRDLHASTSDLQWIVDSYIIVYAGLLLAAAAWPTGSAAEDVPGRPGHLRRLGRRRVLRRRQRPHRGPGRAWVSAAR